MIPKKTEYLYSQTKFKDSNLMGKRDKKPYVI